MPYLRCGLLSLTVCFCLGLASCTVAKETSLKTSGDLVYQARSEINEVQPAELAAEKATLIIDVSEANEFAAGHLPGALHVPRGMLEFKIDTLEPLKNLSGEDRRNHPIVVYCSHGGRGSLSAKTLQDMGYTNVRSLRGGLLAWKTQGFPLEPSGK